MSAFIKQLKIAKDKIVADRLFLSISLIFSFCLYAVAFNNEFVSDDIQAITINPEISNPFYYLFTTVKITMFLKSLIYVAFGPEPFFYHLQNTLYHLMVMVMVYIVTLELSDNKRIGRITTGLYAIHPLLTESVTWISGFGYIFTALVVLFGLWIFILMVKNKLSDKWSIVVAGVYLFALASFDKAVMFPGIITAYILFFSKINKRAMMLLAPTYLVFVIAAIRLAGKVPGRVESVTEYTNGAAVMNPFVQIPVALYSYVKLAIYPVGLTLYHEFNQYSGFGPVDYGISVVVTLCIIGVIFFYWKKRPLVSFALSLFIISLSPTLLPFNIAWVVAERYVYLGAFGLFLVGAILLDTILSLYKIKTEVLVIIVTIILVIFSSLTIKRNLEWRSQDTLWPVTVKVSPNSAYAHNNMGDYYARHGDPENAIRSFDTARKLRPGYADATHNMGNVYFQLGEATIAAELMKEALSYNPNLYQAHAKLGVLEHNAGNYETAIEHLMASAGYNPDPFIELVYITSAYNNLGMSEEASAAYQKALALAQGNQERLVLLQSLVKPQ